MQCMIATFSSNPSATVIYFGRRTPLKYVLYSFRACCFCSTPCVTLSVVAVLVLVLGAVLAVVLILVLIVVLGTVLVAVIGTVVILVIHLEFPLLFVFCGVPLP